MRRRYLVFIVIGFFVLGIGLWLGRTQLLAWYYVRLLAGAEDGDREARVRQVVSLDAAAISPLIDYLSQPDERACGNIATALQSLAVHWGPEDSRSRSLSIKLANAFSRMSTIGQEQVLRLERRWSSVHDKSVRPSNGTLQEASKLLVEAAQVNNPAVRGEALALADDLLAEMAQDPVIQSACRELTQAGMQDVEAANRAHAIRLAQISELNLLSEVVPRLRDSSAEVRRAAILALGPAPDVINDDTLFYWLSDPDEVVRQLCEVALRGRGLHDGHIRLARLMADPRPTLRMQVLEAIEQVPDLDPGVWMRRLSHDPSPAVRAAAVRAAASQTQVDLSERIDEMAQADPSPTVQQVARYYLSCQRIHAVHAETP
jgi:HEAT repeat protein